MSETNYGHPAAPELEITPNQVVILREYSDEVAAGIGLLMPQLDESFSPDPTQRDKLERIINSPDRAQLVCFDPEGNVIGAATMNTLLGAGKEPEGWLEDFVVDKNARGSGVAGLMWEGMEGWCRSQGLRQFSFGTETWRPDAVAFYEKRGATIDPSAMHLTNLLPEYREPQSA